MNIAVVGGGPAGLCAAEVAAQAGARVTLFEKKPSVGRKFLVAGRGGLNLTHEEPEGEFARRYLGTQMPGGVWEGLLAEWGPKALREWAAALGVETFVAGTGRVYPRELKSAGLLRAWVRRLRALGVCFEVRQPLVRIEVTKKHGDRELVRLEFAGGEGWVEADAVVLALGGASWPETGSDGAWVPMLEACGVAVRRLEAANCGWEVAWPKEGLERVEGVPLKNVAVTVGRQSKGLPGAAAGELMITRHGLEGGAIYRVGSALRSQEQRELVIDFKPGSSVEQLARKLQDVRTRWWGAGRERWRISEAAAWVLENFAQVGSCDSAEALARAVKECRVPLQGPRPMDEAISTAGGVAWSELDRHLMLRKLRGVFVAGEMIDWEAPTGGYLLQGAFATGHRAGVGAASWPARGSWSGS